MKKILIIGSGPIVIGQAAEFDYSGTQACLAARQEGYQTILVNSNPATIQTDTEIADTIYIEPLTPESLEKIIAKEKPHGLIATAGGQTGLNLATKLSEKGVLKKYGVKILGTSIKTIQNAENRENFKRIMRKIGQPVLPSKAVTSLQEAEVYVQKIEFPAIARSAFTLGGTGGGIIKDQNGLKEVIENGLSTSPIRQVLLEKSVAGWAEFEYEIVRDNNGNCLCICNMENLDPMGVHTGESIVVAPSQTLSDDDHQILRNAAFAIVAALGIKGACNVQFALNQNTGEYFVIEVNPRLSRSSALASKATGYPIAKIAAKIALGKNLPEIINDITGKSAFFEPSLDYVVIKIPRWPIDKFPTLQKTIGVTMKSTGEVMAIGRSFEEAMVKAIHSLDTKHDTFTQFSHLSKQEIKDLLEIPNMLRMSAIFAAVEKNFSTKQISKYSKIHPWFIDKLKKLLQNKEKTLSSISIYKMVDTCAGEFAALTPYFYSTHGIQNEAVPLAGPKVIILGSGPIRIGQGIEFDYLTVHAVKALQAKGIKAIIINNNPETVSTDYSISDRLYFEPLTPQFVLKVFENEKDGLLGVIPSFGGQTAINLVSSLQKAEVNILGTPPEFINAAENRQKTAEIIEKLGCTMPTWSTAKTKEEVLVKGKQIGFPVLIRPSFVIGGEGMVIAKSSQDIKDYLQSGILFAPDKPLLIDSFLTNAMEVDMDFISDGDKTISFILEQLEPAGIHSGDSSCVFPPQHISKELQKKLQDVAHEVAQAFHIIGLGNLQCAIKNGEVYVLEINPRASRTVPFLSKCVGVSLAKLATNILLGEKLTNFQISSSNFVAIKTPVFSFEKLNGVAQTLTPLMKSTGETMSIGKSYNEALSKI